MKGEGDPGREERCRQRKTDSLNQEQIEGQCGWA